MWGEGGVSCVSPAAHTCFKYFGYFLPRSNTSEHPSVPINLYKLASGFQSGGSVYW